jgi:hypothetical protein
MQSFYENFLFYVGEKFSVFFHAETQESSEVYDYYKDCDDVTRGSLLHLVKRLANFGHIHDETKFRIEDRRHKIYCFKPKQERFFCFFFIGHKIIITSAYTKQKQKIDRNELDKAIQIREEYYKEEPNA